MRPQRVPIIGIKSGCVTLKNPLRETSITRDHCSGRIPGITASSWMPALLTTIWMGPPPSNSCRAASAFSRSATSNATAAAEPPFATISAASFSACAKRLLAWTKTWQPSDARRLHTAAPIPPLPPVTSARFTVPPHPGSPQPCRAKLPHRPRRLRSCRSRAPLRPSTSRPRRSGRPRDRRGGFSGKSLLSSSPGTRAAACFRYFRPGSRVPPWPAPRIRYRKEPKAVRPSAGDFVDRGACGSNTGCDPHPRKARRRADASLPHAGSFRRSLPGISARAHGNAQARFDEKIEHDVSFGFARERFEQGKCPCGRYAQPQFLQGGIGHAGGFLRARQELQFEPCGASPGGLGRQHERGSEAREERARRMQRFRIRLIVGDQGDRFAPRRDLRQGLDQAGAEARVISAEAGGGFPRARRDAPVTRSGVMHGIVKARRRHFRFRRGKRLAHLMQRFAFAGGGREYRRSVRGIAAGILKRLLPYGERKLDRNGGTTPLGGGEQLACWNDRRSRAERLLARENTARRLPALQAWPEQAYAFDEGPHQPATPRTRLQLLPPNPNELVRARVTFACLFSRR